MAANHIGLHGSPRPQRLVCCSRKNQSNWWGAVQPLVTYSFLGSPLRFTRRKGHGRWVVAEVVWHSLAKTVVIAAAAELITVQNLDRHKRPHCQQEIQSARVCSLSKAPIQDFNVRTSTLGDCPSYTGCRGRSGKRVEKEVRKSIIPITRCFSWGGRVGKMTPMPVFFGIWVDTCQYLLWIEVCMKVILMSRNCDLILQIWAMSHIFMFINHTKSTFMSQTTRSVRRWHPSSVIFVVENILQSEPFLSVRGRGFLKNPAVVLQMVIVSDILQLAVLTPGS